MSIYVTSAVPHIPDGVDRSLLHALPEGICRTFRVVAYQHHDGHVLVAAVGADDPITQHVVADRLGRDVILVEHDSEEIGPLLDEAYPPAEAPIETPAARRARMQMARMLTRSGLVSDEQLLAAMVEYARTGDPLDEILVAHGAISEDVRVAALSERYQLQRVGLTRFEPDYELARRLPEPLARRLQAIPVAEAGETMLVAVTRPLDDDDDAAVVQALGRPVRQLLANRIDVDQLIQRVHSERYADVATSLLRDTDPDSSAHVVTTLAQRTVLMTAAVVTVLCGVLWPGPTAIAVVGLCSALYLGVALYRVRLTVHALGTRLETDVTDEELAALDERTLPVYTVLVPLYREAGLVERLVRDLEALDYPRTRLDVKLLCEEDDVETVEAIRALSLPPHFHLVVVPDSLPKTKPKACNYGLQLASGAYCVIYDAEDRPDPDQLKKAVVAFRATTDDVVCIQAKLNHYNQGQNLLTSWFAGEYSMQFELVLPAMGDTDAPIPLGGTSNHFVTATLRDLGAWDPYNVTEDADLGVRLHREGFRTAMIDSTTLEEANSAVGNWVRQRSRWNKGYLQTWLVHMRHPLRLARQTGLRGFLAFNLTMGATAVLLLNPVFWTLTALYALTHWSAIEQVFPSPVYYVASLMLLVGNFAFVYLNVAGALQRGEFGLVRTALVSPLYWALMSYAAWKGFLQLFTNPFYWEKTEHGLHGLDPAVRDGQP